MCLTRIQRLIVRALPYNFHIMYVPGKLIPMANALSRNLKILTSEDEEEDQISLPILAVNYITGNYQQHPDKPVIDLDQGGNLQKCHITIADKVHQIVVGLQFKRNFQRNCTLTGIIEMNFLSKTEPC